MPSIEFGFTHQFRVIAAHFSDTEKNVFSFMDCHTRLVTSTIANFISERNAMSCCLSARHEYLVTMALVWICRCGGCTQSSVCLYKTCMACIAIIEQHCSRSMSASVRKIICRNGKRIVRGRTRGEGGWCLSCCSLGVKVALVLYVCLAAHSCFS